MNRRSVLAATGAATVGLVGTSGCLGLDSSNGDPPAKLCFARLFNEDDQPRTLDSAVETPSEDGDGTTDVFAESYDLEPGSLKRIEPDLGGSGQYVVRASSESETVRVSLSEKVADAEKQPEGIALTFRVVSGDNFPWDWRIFPEC